MANKSVTIAKKFTLNRDDGTSVTYSPGTHSMPEADASHWFTALHVETAKAVESVEEAAQAAVKSVKGGNK